MGEDIIRRWELQARALETGETCGKCGAELGDKVCRYAPLLDLGYGGGGARWSSKPTTDAVPICEECAPDWLLELRTMVYSLDVYSHKAPCKTCGREVFFVSSSANFTGTAFCSKTCKSQHQAREVSRNRTCEICGEEFTATRSDAKTCSPACRQKAHRRRSKPVL